MESKDLSQPEVSVEPEEIRISEQREARLPVNFVALGEIDVDDVKVYIKQDVYNWIEKYSRSDTGRELGSILLGSYVESLGKTSVVITDVIEAKYTDASKSTLTFTHDTWAYVHQEHDTKHPQLGIVGWQHTHPNYGVFLSNYDMFIQENFFNLPFQVAYVVDPVRHIRGFFQWKSGKVERLKGFYVYDDMGKAIKLAADNKPSEKAPGARGAAPRWQAWAALALFAALSVFLAALALTFKGKLAEQEERQIALETEITQLQALRPAGEGADDADGTGESIRALQEIVLGNVLETGTSEMIKDLVARLETNELNLANETDVIAELNGALDRIKSGAAFEAQTISGGTYTIFSDEVGYIGFRGKQLSAGHDARFWEITALDDTSFSIASNANDDYRWIIFGNSIQAGSEVELSKAAFCETAGWQLLEGENGNYFLSPAGHPELFLAYHNGFSLCLFKDAIDGEPGAELFPVVLSLVG